MLVPNRARQGGGGRAGDFRARGSGYRQRGPGMYGFRCRFCLAWKRDKPKGLLSDQKGLHSLKTQSVESCLDLPSDRPKYPFIRDHIPLLEATYRPLSSSFR